MTAAVPASAGPPAPQEVSPEYFKQAATEPAEFVDGHYMVQLDGDPIATYAGGEAGIAATAPDSGETIDFDAAEVEQYRGHLQDERERLLDEFSLDPTAEYDTVFSGFAAELTAAEAEALAASDKVTSVVPDQIYELTTASTPEFLGLEGDTGAWNTQFGDPEAAGEGVIVGVLDTGVWPENPSLQPLPEPRPDQDVIDAKWNGECVEGDEDDPESNVSCNNKLIGARWFDARGSAADGYASPRDQDGHGTHTATTAAGNHESEVVMDGQDFGTVSGMAPAARVAAYKVCWGGCAGADLVAGVEAAVADGVDVINFSIGSLGTNEFVDAVSIAFFNAAASGVFVSSSAGNNGPGSTVDHQEPWVTTVAASTHDQSYRSQLTFGDTTVPAGAINGAAEYPIKPAADAALDGTEPDAAAGCGLETLDPDKAEGFAILCERGNLFSDMAQEVADAGGAALVVRDVEDMGEGDTVTSQPVPTIHVGYTDGLDLVEWVEDTEDPTVSVTTSQRQGQNAPEMADFSSAGPALAAGQNLLKPDITAPGVEILAGLTPEHNRGNDYGAAQGTSMAAPHIAGLAALLISANPDWSPTAVKSAIMTTAYSTDAEGDVIQREGEDATPFDFGAGHVDGAGMFEPGLVYESTPTEWIQYICGTAEADKIAPNCDEHGAIDPSQLNYPSVTVAELAGVSTISRTVTNVSDRYGVYKADIEAPEGATVSVDKPLLLVAPGESATYTLTIEHDGGAFDQWAWGDITWEDLGGWGLDRTQVRSPIVVKPAQVGIDEEVSLSEASGETTLNGTAGFDGSLTASVSGLAASDVAAAELTDPDGSSFPTEEPAESSHTVAYEYTTPADASLVRFATFEEDLPEGADLDMYVYTEDEDGVLTMVDSSASGGSNESLTLPGGHTYTVFVDLWDGPASVDTELHSWVVSDTDEGNLTASPEQQDVTLGEPFELDLAWEGLEEGSRYLGTVDLSADEEPIDATIVNVTP